MSKNRLLGSIVSEQSQNVSFDNGTLYIDASNNRIGIGTTNSPTNKNTVTPRFVVNGSGINGGFQVVRNTTVGSGGAQNTLSATRGSDVNSYTILQNGDGIGTLNFSGADGVQFISAAHIQAQVDGTPGTDSMPARLIFGTTPSGAYTPTERMRITSSGNMGIGTSSPISKLAVAVTSDTTDLGSTGLTIGGATTLTSGNVLMLNFTPIGADSNRARAGIGCEVGADWGKGNLTFYTKNLSGAGAMSTSDERMRITSDGYVGIGTTSPSYKLHVAGNAAFQDTYPLADNAYTLGSASLRWGDFYSVIVRCTSNMMVGTTSAFGSARLSVDSASGDWTGYFRNASSPSPYGVIAYYSAASPNGTGNHFYWGSDNAGDRYKVASNGGIYNYQANDVNLSDLAVKQDFTVFSQDTALTESIWQFGKRMKNAWGRFKYDDQTHSDWNNGYGAQLVRDAAGDDFPELVEETAWKSDGEEKNLLMVYDSDLMHLFGYIVTVAQERIEALEAKVAALEAKNA